MKNASSIKTVTERSVNNLQTLFTVVIALALVEAIKSIIAFKTSLVSINFNVKFLPTFVALVSTLIPFHHGANRYLDETYIVKQGPIRPLTGLIDFFFFFFEAAVFYVMALSIQQPKFFFFALLFLFGIDIIWLIFVYYSANESFKKIKHWLWLNILLVIVVLIINPGKFMADDIYKWILLAIFVVGRTVLDYIFEWPFYWPAYDASDSNNLD
jgi:hypothetical protein